MLVEEGSETIKNVDFHQEFEKSKERASLEMKKLRLSLEELEAKWKTTGKAILNQELTNIKDRFDTFKTHIKERDEKYDLEEKLVEIKKYITKLNNRKL